MCGIITQLVEHHNGIAKVPVKTQIFFSFFKLLFRKFQTFNYSKFIDACLIYIKILTQVRFFSADFHINIWSCFLVSKFLLGINRPFPRCRKPLFENEAKYKTFLVKLFFIIMQIKLIFTRKVLHLASF